MNFKLRREHTGKRLTWQGRLLLFALSLGLFSLLFFNLYGFLAPDSAPKTGIMVVEGWIHDDALAEAARLFETGNYSMIACTGIPIETGSYLQEFKSYSEMTAARLSELGVPKSRILVCTANDYTKDRTYQSAVALRDAFIKEKIGEKKLHLVTTGPHGRRSRMLFKKALGKEYEIGITCLPEATYKPSKWFACSEGVRAVVGETIAYVYAKLFFHP
ncbi:MAG: YdcF family protein [Pontiellaceae bacterium]|nr:YdcF family protein [Pontiellaceae bacterium]